MKRAIVRFVLLIGVALGVLAIAGLLEAAQAAKDDATYAAESLEDGRAAYHRGDFDSALKLFSDAAKRGNTDALVYLAWMHGNGCGVTASSGESDKLMQRAAGAGNAGAKYWEAIYISAMVEADIRPAMGVELPKTEANRREARLDEARKLALESAEGGYPLAIVGRAREYGDKSSPSFDPIRAYAWSSLALRRLGKMAGPTDDIFARDRGDMDQEFGRIADSLSPDQIARGKALTEELEGKIPQVIEPLMLSPCTKDSPAAARPRVRLYSIEDIGTLGGSHSWGLAINDNGQVVGDSSLSGALGGTPRSIVDAAKRDGWGPVSAYGINREGIVVGSATTSNRKEHAFVYYPAAGMRDLNDLIPPSSGWEVIEARGINASGQIIGWGIVSGDKHAFLLTPTN